MIYWKCLLLGAIGREWVQGWTVSKSVGETVSDEPDCDGSSLWHGEAKLTPEQLLGAFTSSHWWAFAALWWPHGSDSKEQLKGGWGLGTSGVRGVIHFTTMSLFMGHTTRDGVKCYCPQEAGQHTLPKCYTSSDRLTNVCSSWLCIFASARVHHLRSANTVCHQRSQRLSYSIAFKSWDLWH